MKFPICSSGVMTRLVIACAALVFACILATLTSAQSASLTPTNARWRGVWQATLEGQPGVILTLAPAEDTGELAGTVVFNMIMRDGGAAHVGGSMVHLVTHPHLEGRNLTFLIKRPSDAKVLEMTVTLIDDDKASIHCQNCGADTPISELIRSRS